MACAAQDSKSTNSLRGTTVTTEYDSYNSYYSYYSYTRYNMALQGSCPTRPACAGVNR
jgi:hypothetical protein